MVNHPPRHVTRRFAIFALFAAVLFTLTGCLRMNIAIELLENDLANVQVDMAFQNSVVEEMGYDPEELWESQFATMNEDLPPGATFERYPEPGWTGARIIMHDVPISEQESFEELGVADLSVIRDGNYFVFESRTDVGDDLGGAAGTDTEAIEGVEMNFTLTCPGPVVESNGTVSGNSVVWDLTQFTSAQQLTARCQATPQAAGHVAGSGEGFARWWPILLVALLVLAALAALAYFLRRNSHKERDLVPSNFGDTANWQTDQSDNLQPYVAPHAEVEQSQVDEFGQEWTDDGNFQ